LAASYAHALARTGQLAEARNVIARAMKRTASREHSALLKWLEQGAPADKDHPLPRPAPVRAIAASGRSADAAEGETARRTRTRRDDPDGPSARRPPLLTELDGVLARGLARLSLDDPQRERAKPLPRDAVRHFWRPSAGRAGTAVHAVAAAVAYAIVYV